MSGDSRFYGTLEKALLVGILGASGLGSINGGRVADELVKIRETLTQAIARVEDHERRLTNLETLYLRTSR